jgi:hypothetical protein
MKSLYITEYNKNIGTANRSDMMIISKEHVRNSLKWYKKLFFHFHGTVLLNFLAVYNAKTVRNITMADFQPTLIGETLQKYHEAKPSARTG